jgi:hypothetical protein
VLESLVDLTYRGISLSRRIKLTQVRPTSGYLELGAPMPVGTELAIIADDGLTFTATVSGVHEQVMAASAPATAGATGAMAAVSADRVDRIDRIPGMQIVPRLDAEAAAAWWQARVTLTDDDAPKLSAGRNRPVTVRPRTHTRPTPPSPEAPVIDAPAIIADLTSRVTAAAGLEPKLAAVEPKPAVVEPAAAIDGELMRPGEHVVVDDGAKTMTMLAVDVSALGLEPGTSGAMPAQVPPAADDEPDDSGDPAPPAGAPKRKRKR